MTTAALPTISEILARADAMLTRSESEKASYEVGYIAGRDDARRDYDRGWNDHAALVQNWLAPVRSTLKLPTQAELRVRRGENHLPCQDKCRSCWKCQQSLEYWGHVSVLDRVVSA